jgi:hypothetical protein
VCEFCKKKIIVGKTYFIFSCGHAFRAAYNRHKYLPAPGFPKKCCLKCYPKQGFIFMPAYKPRRR